MKKGSNAQTIIVNDSSVRELLEMVKNMRGTGGVLMRANLKELLLQGVNRGAELLLGLAIKERFTGKGPFPVFQNRLGVRRGRLRRGLRATKARARKGLLTLRMGSNVKYFGRHEFGYRGQERVKAHAVKRHKVKNAFGSGKTYTRKKSFREAHWRGVDQKARRPLQTAIKQHATRLFGNSIERSLIEFLGRIRG